MRLAALALALLAACADRPVDAPPPAPAVTVTHWVDDQPRERRVSYGVTHVLYEAALDWWSGVLWSESRPTAHERIWLLCEAVARSSPDLEHGLWLVALAQSETDFSAPVLDGRCNSAAYRRERHVELRGTCDHGNAFGPWQMHLDEQRRPGDPTGAEAIANQERNAAAALRWLRDTPTAWGSAPWQRARALRWLAARNAR